LSFWAFARRSKNPLSNCGDFAVIKSGFGLNSYKISVEEWVEKSQATKPFITLLMLAKNGHEKCNLN